MKKHFVKTWTNNLTGAIEHCQAFEEYVEEDKINPVIEDTALVIVIPGNPPIEPSYDIEEFELDNDADEMLHARQIMGMLEVQGNAVVVKAGQPGITMANRSARRDFKIPPTPGG